MCWFVLAITLFRSAFSYLASIILHILRVDIIVPSDYRHLSTYELIKEYSGLTVLSVKDVKLQLLTPTMDDKHPSYIPLWTMITLPENLRSSPSAVISSLPRIMLYLPLVDSSTWYFHVTIFFVPNFGRQKYTFTFFEVANLTA